MKKQTAVEWLEQQLNEKRGEHRFPLMNSESLFEQAKQKEKEQQESEQIELIKWIQDSLTSKEFYVTYDAEELLEKFKTK
jgi:hypothetical protein